MERTHSFCYTTRTALHADAAVHHPEAQPARGRGDGSRIRRLHRILRDSRRARRRLVCDVNVEANGATCGRA